MAQNAFTMVLDLPAFLKQALELRTMQYDLVLPKDSVLHVTLTTDQPLGHRLDPSIKTLFFHDCMRASPRARCVRCLTQPLHLQHVDFPILWVNRLVRLEALDVLLSRNKLKGVKVQSPDLLVRLCGLPKFTFQELHIDAGDLTEDGSEADWLQPIKDLAARGNGTFEHVVVTAGLHLKGGRHVEGPARRLLRLAMNLTALAPASAEVTTTWARRSGCRDGQGRLSIPKVEAVRQEFDDDVKIVLLGGGRGAVAGKQTYKWVLIESDPFIQARYKAMYEARVAELAAAAAEKEKA
ncbi:uncharacterized protein HMPREF1541_07687 [Cyphellophora europaea CBS 101466]|uniref:Uncharacterized protein n=1 Tax=Cyphellophora europaea (strain CBS 101466) TaxID=1220924 RepID=W2RQS2_CYPE1|nr:uncharacterized protein HMPREF1541_07687 [Cyphellophora europaea CBS 101466]ETN38063.1 hypothetical protein HMPREF1541_07687 [Cyphellophora europaea CBS 101466]